MIGSAGSAWTDGPVDVIGFVDSATFVGITGFVGFAVSGGWANFYNYVLFSTS